MNKNRKNLIIVILIFLLVSLLVSLTLLLTSSNTPVVNVAGGSCSKKSNAPETTCYYVTCNQSTEGACLTGGGTCCQWTPSPTTSTCHTCSNGACSQKSVDGYCPNFGYLAGGCGDNTCQVVNPPPPPPPPTGNVGECGGCSQGGAITCSSGTCCSCGKCGGVSKTCNAICNQNACGGGVNPPPPPPPPSPNPVPPPNPPPTPTPPSSTTTSGSTSTTNTTTTTGTTSTATSTTGGSTTQTTGSTSSNSSPLPSTGIEDTSPTIIFGVIALLVGFSLSRIRKKQ